MLLNKYLQNYIKINNNNKKKNLIIQSIKIKKINKIWRKNRSFRNEKINK